MRFVVAVVALVLGACASAPPAGLPRGEVWVAHLERDLAPFWTSADAIGNPVGDFPTFRCHDGRVFDRATNPCPELTEAGAWIADNLDRDYVRMQSRQTYFYGVAFHLTGNPRMLELARAGARWIRTREVIDDGTAQDLAYRQLGIAMLYYLTRDAELLEDLVRWKERIFRDFDDGHGMLRWVANDDTRKELVAQLDQINGYMLLVTPVLPEPHRTEWLRDMERLADAMIARYFNTDEGMFRGTLHEPKFYGSRHTDFGHTIKALWMIERIGRLAGRDDLVAFGRTHGARVLARAWSDGCWATGIRENGELDRALVWWSFAELDQMAATLALHDSKAAEKLPDAYRCWFGKLVDREHHEVWNFVDPDDPSRHFGKAHLWKNGYHSAEHALVGYLTAQALYGERAQLWFAFDARARDVRPYFFDGRVEQVERLDGVSRVTFSRLR